MALEERIVKKHLYEWLLDHNSLTIPELGKFEATPTSASIQAGVYKFLPPNKKVTFHATHDASNTELCEVLMARENLTTEQANYTIQTFVQKVKEALASRQRYELEGFGMLNQINDETVIFRIDEETNVEGDSFGLPGLYPKPLVHDTAEPAGQASSLTRTNPDLPAYVPQDDKEDDFVPVTKPHIHATATSKTPEDDITVEEKIVSRSGDRFLILLLTLMFLAGIVFVIWLITDSNNLSSTANKKEEKVKEDKKEPIKEEKKEEPKQAPKEDFEKTPPKSTTPTIDYPTNSNYVAGFSWLPQQPANLSQILHNTRAGKAYTVLGSFDKPENAYSFYNNLVKRGVATACMVAPVAGNTRYRVCLGKFESVEQATKEGLAFGKVNSMAFFILTY